MPGRVTPRPLSLRLPLPLRELGRSGRRAVGPRLPATVRSQGSDLRVRPLFACVCPSRPRGAVRCPENRTCGTDLRAFVLKIEPTARLVCRGLDFQDTNCKQRAAGSIFRTRAGSGAGSGRRGGENPPAGRTSGPHRTFTTKVAGGYVYAGRFCEKRGILETTP